MKPDAADIPAKDRASTDVLTAEQRRLVMSRIKGKDTKPELLIRRGLHGRGLRFRLHGSGLPGRPDLVFPRHRAVLFVHGCFWHGHECPLFRWPTTRADFWGSKIRRNRERDLKTLSALNTGGWRALIIWECALKGKNRKTLPDVLDESEAFIRNRTVYFSEIKGG